MKEKISLYKKRSFETLQKFTKNQKIFRIVGILLVVGAIATLIYADAGHDTAEPIVQKQTEQVVVRKVGDVDAYAISQ